MRDPELAGCKGLPLYERHPKCALPSSRKQGVIGAHESMERCNTANYVQPHACSQSLPAFKKRRRVPMRAGRQEQPAPLFCRDLWARCVPSLPAGLAGGALQGPPGHCDRAAKIPFPGVGTIDRSALALRCYGALQSIRSQVQILATNLKKGFHRCNCPLRCIGIPARLLQRLSQ